MVIEKNKKLYSFAVCSGAAILEYTRENIHLSSEAKQNTAAGGSLMSGVVRGSDFSTLKNQAESAWKSEWQSAG